MKTEKQYRDSARAVGIGLTAILFITLMAALTGCGQDNGPVPSGPQCLDQNLNGVWNKAGGGLIHLNPDCTGRIDFCGQDITYTLPVNGVASLTMLNNSPIPACGNAGTVQCSLTYTSTNMGLNCGGGVIFFTKQ